MPKKNVTRIRAYTTGTNNLVTLCSHMSIRGKVVEEYESSEYKEFVDIYCKMCNTVYQLVIYVN